MINKNKNSKVNQFIRKLKEISEICIEFDQAKEIQDTYKNDHIMQELTENILDHCRNKYQIVSNEIDTILDSLASESSKTKDI